jgi:uncharacterized protein (TIGR00730 family)
MDRERTNQASPTLAEARARLRRTIEEYVTLDSELRALENTNYRVCIFGSARIRPQDPVYRSVFRLAQSLSERGIDVVTGGGPGLMAAANRGVLASKRHRSTSYGLPLDLPTLTEPPNRHLDIASAHKRFSSRLDEFIRLSHAVVVAPGGIGTLLELMYVWQLLQLRALEGRPVILLGREFWGGLLEWVRSGPAEQRLLDLRDLECLHLVDTPEEALEILDRSHAEFLAAERALLTDPASPADEPERMIAATGELAQELSAQTELAEAALHSLAS